VDVVVRVLREEFACQPDVRRQFLDLCKRSMRMVHQNLVVTRDVQFFPKERVYYIVRDHVPGVTLQNVLAGGRKFDPPQVLAVLRQVIGALEPAHREKLAHGAVKPSNIFLCPDGRAVLGDLAPPCHGAGTAIAQRLAYDYRYAAPETLVESDRATPASDLYSVGCLAYELFCGRPPFVADHYNQVLLQQVNSDPDPATRHRPELGPAVDRFLAILLAKAPAVRPESAQEGLDLLAELEGQCVGPRPRRIIAEASLRRYEPVQTAFSIGPDRPIGLTVSPEEPPPPPPPPPAAPKPPPEPVSESSMSATEWPTLALPPGNPDASQSGVVVVAVPGKSPPPPDPDSPHTGTVSPDHTPRTDQLPFGVPGYEILEELGRGGMGAVYKARQLSLNRPVALKMMLGARFADPQGLARFLAEAEVVAEVRHPNVVQVYEFGEHAGVPYMAMEFCPGGTLSGREKPIPPRAAAALVEKIARGVAAAHNLGIVHRDLKPANVLFDPAGEPKVADFGLARRINEDRGLTRTGAILGTPTYMAPEQASGKTKLIGPTADVWSLGVTLYEFMTGSRPFDGDDIHVILTRVLFHPPAPPRRVRASVPRHLEVICLKCLAQDPADRYPTAGELADDLRRFLAREPIAARPPSALTRLLRWWRGR
jgi:serine/threonine protein kinase